MTNTQRQDESPLTQNWEFSRCCLPKAGFSGQRRFLDKMRSPQAGQVLAGLWSLAGRKRADATSSTPPELGIVFDQRVGHLEVIIVRLPPPHGPGAHFVALIFSEYEGRYAEEVDAGMEILIWEDDGRGALMRFVKAAGFVPQSPGIPAPSPAVPLQGGNLGFFGEDLSLQAFVVQIRRYLGKPTLLSRLRGLLGRRS